MATTLPRRTPGESGHASGIPDREHGVPSRELRERAAGGWDRFLRRFANEQPDERAET
ncbi:hypothetical protein [Streptomyces narbonensis]|uniref:hypothetical protein n=1 Tax=Streptomyces narbonensis TaxID=67333 RepID=UPI003411721E